MKNNSQSGVIRKTIVFVATVVFQKTYENASQEKVLYIARSELDDRHLAVSDNRNPIDRALGSVT